jgi:hypothetical protein
VTTVFVRQGAYAHDAAAIGGLPPADVTIERIADLSNSGVLPTEATALQHASA